MLMDSMLYRGILAIGHQEFTNSYIYGINGDWIVRDDENLIWLPLNYRPSAWTVLLGAFAIGCPSGRVWICKLLQKK
ncbi:uncharacterized protein BCR38DRAFT_415688 [Pseudomassariella vexata]|uniref:Uncharacterized protein n=1 Tax=Pseudomassariella vexata TaxID=1141098 RepID=A0A1Y2EIF4_9PEZI|nr:uncharacterized protein BCR38DRAFT_415688 [Pseudomassariella vexata]ORY71006.1 hypothetical protein BCR38DRAFT_415688 [Pseudomassariella vexata]